MKKILLGLVFLAGLVFLSASNPGEALAVDTPYLRGQYQGNDTVYLTWSDRGADHYQVMYGPLGDEYAHGFTVNRDVRNFHIRELFQNTTYVFRVKSMRGDEVSMHSNAVSQWVGQYGRHELYHHEHDGHVHTPAEHYDPAADTMRSDASWNDPHISSGKPGYGLQNMRTVSGPYAGEITLYFNDASLSEVGSYNIVYTDEKGVEKWGALHISGDARSFTVRGLTPGVRYWFWMSNERTGQTPWVSDIAR